MTTERISLLPTDTGLAQHALLDLPANVRVRAEGVAAILADLELDAVLTEAGYAVALLETGTWNAETLPPQISPEAARLAQEVLALPAVESTSILAALTPSPEQAEKLRQLLLAVIRDARVLVIRLAERLHDLHAAKQLSCEAQQAQAQAAREIYAPLASRLGIWQLKWELEDLAFRYLEPDNYRQVANWLNERRADRETFIGDVVASLEQELNKVNIRASIAGRPKHIYSIWRKMQRKQLPFNELHDVRAVRVLVDSVAECYAALGVVHMLWRPLPREFDDYISVPKGNFYRSLHTAVLGPDQRSMEIQIRTWEMHRHAELGVASHWRYKEGGRYDAGLETRLGWLRQLLTPADNDADFIDRFRAELVGERVYVFTPKGEVVDLPHGATPLDFAYYIHTDVGHRCRGARVNGRWVPLTYVMENSDRVEILTGRKPAPSRDWLNPAAGFLATPRARDKLRAFFRAEDREQNLHYGRETLERELTRLGLRDFPHERLLAQFHFENLDDLLAALGAGDFTAAQLAGALQRESAVEPPQKPAPSEIPHPRASETPAVAVAGVGNLLTHLARCCHPLPGETIHGYVTRGRGISVHRADCASFQRLLVRAPNRALPVSWQAQGPIYAAEVIIETDGRRNLVPRLSAVIGHEKIRLLARHGQIIASGGPETLRFSVAVSGRSELSRLLTRLAQVPGVLRAIRI